MTIQKLDGQNGRYASHEDLESPYLQEELFSCETKAGWRARLEALDAESPYQNAFDQSRTEPIKPEEQEESIAVEEELPHLTLSVPSGCQQKLKNTSVAVVGGGLAGLMAARQLRQCGIKVTVFEARSQVGGRVRSNMNWSSDRIIEEGAELIGSFHTYWLALAQEYGLSMISRMDRDLYERERLEVKLNLDTDKNLTMPEICNLDKKMDEVLWQIAKDATMIHDPFMPWNQPELKKYDDMTVADALVQYRNRPNNLLWKYIEFKLVNDEVAPLEEMNYLGLLCKVRAGQVEHFCNEEEAGPEKCRQKLPKECLEKERLMRYWNELEIFRCADGCQTLANEMANEIRKDYNNIRSKILLKRAVTSIQLSNKGISITSTDVLNEDTGKTSGKKYTSNGFSYAVLAAPPSVWDGITIKENDSITTLARIGMNPAIKHFSNVKERFWIKKKAAPYGGSWKIGQVWEGTDNQTRIPDPKKGLSYSRQGTVLSVFAGPIITQISSTGKTIRRAPNEGEIKNGLKELYPDYIGNLNKKPLYSNWPTKPFIMTGYASPRKGEVFSLGQFYSKPWNGWLFFAGEHTQMDFFGYMEGALRSGDRAAREIVQQICNRQTASARAAPARAKKASEYETGLVAHHPDRDLSPSSEVDIYPNWTEECEEPEEIGVGVGLNEEVLDELEEERMIVQTGSAEDESLDCEGAQLSEEEDFEWVSDQDEDSQIKEQYTETEEEFDSDAELAGGYYEEGEEAEGIESVEKAERFDGDVRLAEEMETNDEDGDDGEDGESEAGSSYNSGEEDYFEGQTSAKGNAAQPILDLELAIAPFASPLKRRLFPLLSPAKSKKAQAWNAARHPAKSGADPQLIQDRLKDYIDLSSIESAIKQLNAANPSTPIDLSASIVNGVFVEAIHQFQQKCFTEKSKHDGKAGSNVLHSLGIIEPKGKNPLAQVNNSSKSKIKDKGIRGKIGSTVIDYSNWFDFIVNPSIFGWTTDIDPGIHYELAKRLRHAENLLLSMPTFKGLIPAELGSALGITEVHKGYRRTRTNDSYHNFGLGLDISYDANPWVRGERILEIIKDATVLHGRSGSDMSGGGSAQKYLSSLSKKYTTAQIHDILHQHHEDFVGYLSYADNLQKIKDLISKNASSGLLNPRESLDAIALRWQKKIRGHVQAMNGDAGKITFMCNNGTRRDYQKGFFSLKKELVITLRDKTCLAWGAVDFGPGEEGSGDIMHFDMRSIDPFSRIADQAMVHPCRSGWHDASPNGESEITLPPRPAGWNQGVRAVGNILRIPLEGLILGYQHPDSQPKMTYEDAQGKAIVLVPKGLDATKPLDVLLYFHGDGPGYRQANRDFCILPRQGCLKKGFIEDVETARISQQLQASNRQIVAILPQCPHGGSRGGWNTNCDRYLAEIFDRLVLMGIWRQKPLGHRVILAGHSRGGDTILGMIASKRRLIPSNLAGLVLFDGIHSGGYQSWALQRLDSDLLKIKELASSSEQLAYLLASMKFRAYHAGSSYTSRHTALDKAIRDWFAKNQKMQPGISTNVWDALKANYQVIAAGHSDHFLVGKPMNNSLGEPPLLNALKGLPATSPAGSSRPSTPSASQLLGFDSQDYFDEGESDLSVAHSPEADEASETSEFMWEVSPLSEEAASPFLDGHEQDESKIHSHEMEEIEQYDEDACFEAEGDNESDEHKEWEQTGLNEGRQTLEYDTLEYDTPRCKTGKSYPTTVSFVPEVAKIMQAKGWEIGARFQRRWLNGKANRLTGKISDGMGSDRQLAIEKVSMDWVLGFDRARDMFNAFKQYDVILSPKAKKLLEQRINPLVAKMEAWQDSVPFGSYPEGLARENQYINYVSMDAYDTYTRIIDDGLDDLDAALGRFSMFAIPKGKVFLRNNRIVVLIQELGIYIRDSYDFEGDQELGRWKLPDKAEPVFEAPLVDRMKSACSDSWFYMANWIYREYRNTSGQFGEDFLVYSDIKTVRLEPNYEYEYANPAWGSSPAGVSVPPASSALPATSTFPISSASSYKDKTFIIESADARLRNEDLSMKKYGTGDTLPAGKKMGNYVTLPKGMQAKIANMKTDHSGKVFVLVYDAVRGNAASPLGWTSSENFKGKLHNETLGIVPAIYIVSPAVRTDFFTIGNHETLIRKGSPGYQPDKSKGKLTQGSFVAVVDESQDSTPKGRYVKVKSLKKSGNSFTLDRDLGWTAKSNLVAGLADYKGPNSAWQSAGKGKQGDYIKQIDLLRIVAHKGKMESISRDIYSAYIQMVDAAATEGIKIILEDGFRSYPDQARLYRLYKQGKGNLAAPPGSSNHQNGIAFDLVVQHTANKGVGTGLVYGWLKKNATSYGFVRTVPTEAWHWEYHPSLAAILKAQGDYKSWNTPKQENEDLWDGSTTEAEMNQEDDLNSDELEDDIEASFEDLEYGRVEQREEY